MSDLLHQRCMFNAGLYKIFYASRGMAIMADLCNSQEWEKNLDKTCVKYSKYIVSKKKRHIFNEGISDV
jgi:hypothetical protein